MPGVLQLLVLLALTAHSIRALKLSPAEWFSVSPISPIQKRQNAGSSSISSVTTFTTNFGTNSRANTCVCRLVTAFTPFVTITSTYTATDSNDGTSTTTLASQSGSVPGTVEVVVPVSFVTTTSYYDAATSSTTTLAQPSGTNPGTVLVALPAQYVTVTSYDNSFSAPATTTVTTYTGGTAPGTIVIVSPGVYITTYRYTLSPGASMSTTTLTTYTGGTVPGTIEIDEAGVYTTFTTYWGQSSTATSTGVTYTGPSGSSTIPGTILVILPASQAPPATEPTATILSRYTAPATTARQVLPSGDPTTPTASTFVAAPTGCDNQGLEWAEYPNTSGDWSRPGPNNNPPGYIGFSVEPYKNTEPRFQGVTPNVAGFSYVPTSQGNITIYDSHTINSDYWVLNHQGYIFAPQTGIYNFTTYSADDIVLLWIGSIAYSGWSRSNAAFEQVYNDPPQGFTGYPGEPPISFTVDLEQGKYYPLRIVYANAQRQAEFHIYATTPDGTQFLGPDTNGSSYFVQYSCDMTTAPKFPRFGDQS